MKSNYTRTLRVFAMIGVAGAYAGCGGVDDGSDGDGESALPASTSQNGVSRSDGWARWGHPWHHGPITVQGGSPSTGGSGSGAVSSGGTGGGPSVGGTGNAGTPGTLDCAVCAKAQACCESVTDGPLCSFSEATCESLDAVRKQAYVNDCKVLLTTTLSVRTAAPSVCL